MDKYNLAGMNEPFYY